MSENSQPPSQSDFIQQEASRTGTMFHQPEGSQQQDQTQPLLNSVELIRQATQENNTANAAAREQNRTMSNLGSKLERGSQMQASQDDGERLDSVLGETNRDVLLKAVIQKSEFCMRRLEETNSKLTLEISTNDKNQQKTNKFLMDSHESLQSLLNDQVLAQNEKMKQTNDTIKLMLQDMGLLTDLVKMGRSGNLVEVLSNKIKDDIDKGPIAEIREQYAPRASVEKDIMKVQNTQRKIIDEQKSLAQMRQQLHERIDLLKEVYLPIATFTQEIKAFAPQRLVDEMKRKLDRCAMQEKTVAMFDRLDRLQEQLSRRVNSDFVTKDAVNGKMRDMNQQISMELVSKQMLSDLRGNYDDRIANLHQTVVECKKALQNHTKHITSTKKELETKATKRNLDDLVKQMKRFSLNEEFKELYEKVVPPVSIMQKETTAMHTQVEQFKEIVAQYDVNLSTKASKQDVLDVDNKFRNFLKKGKFKQFKETTELDYHEMKTDVNHVVQVVAKVTKTLPNDIQVAVRKATHHLRNQTSENLGKGQNMDQMLIEVHAAQTQNKQDGQTDKPKEPKIEKKKDQNAEVKDSLIKVLNSKASHEEIEQLRYEKTNKTDTDMQMKSLDIMHKQMVQLSTVLLDHIKQGVTTKLQTETEKQQKLKFLLQQQGHVLEWVSQFDPQNINSDDLHMPKQLVHLASYSENLAKALPEFLDHTVNHRLKQVAQKNSMRYLSQSIDVSLKKNYGKDNWSRLAPGLGGHSPSPMRQDAFDRSFQAGLPYIEPKLAPLTTRSKKVITQVMTPAPLNDHDDKSSFQHSRYQTRFGFQQNSQTERKMRSPVKKVDSQNEDIRDSIDNQFYRSRMRPNVKLSYTSESLAKAQNFSKLNNTEIFYESRNQMGGAGTNNTSPKDSLVISPKDSMGNINPNLLHESRALRVNDSNESEIEFPDVAPMQSKQLNQSSTVAMMQQHTGQVGLK